MSEAHCRDCRNWHKKINPANIAEQTGQCRRRIEIIPMPVGPGQIQTIVFYPDVPGDMPACSHLVERRPIIAEE